MWDDKERFSIQDVPMHVFRFVRPLAVGALAVVALVTALLLR